MPSSNTALINKVTRVVRLIETLPEIIDRQLELGFPVYFDFKKHQAHIDIPTYSSNSGEAIDYNFLEPLIEITKKYKINFQIVYRDMDNTLCIKIYE